MILVIIKNHVVFSPLLNKLPYSGGNFCAGYDLGELSSMDIKDMKLPDISDVNQGRGPMVNHFVNLFFIFLYRHKY